MIKSIANWLVWRLDLIEGEKKPRKVPYYSNGARRHSSNGTDEDRAQLVSYDRAVAACERGNYSGLGFALLPDCGVVALDFDDVVVDGVVDPQVLRVVAGTYAEFSPSGNGVRAFYLGSAGSRKSLKIEPKIEVFGTSGYVTFTGRVLPEHDMLDWTEPVAFTPACTEFLADRFGDVTPMESSGGGFESLMPTMGLTEERVREVLAKLPTDMDYEDWVRVGMAVHQEMGAGAFEVWHDWSKTSGKYTSREYCHERWRSFGKYTGGAHLTFAWVLKQAGESMQREAHDAVKGLRQQILDTTDEFELRTRVATVIRGDDRLASIDRAMLAQALQERFAALGSKLPIAEVRKLLAPQRADKATLPVWCQGWVYVTSSDRFVRVGTDDEVTKQGFDAKFNRQMPAGDNGARPSAASVVLDDYGMKVVAKALYVPWAPEYFEHERMECVNRFSKASVPDAAENSGGWEKVVLQHLDHICNGRADVVDWLVKWLAWQVQKPGEKVRWSPVVKGIEGDGKTVLGEMLGGVMGRGNVKTISPSAIQSEFTGWAEGACVGVLEELKLTGHNRFDVLNKLKPYITNSDVEIIKKGRDPVSAHNTMNYLAFTNHADALPISDTDRRWFVVFTPWACIEEMEARVGDVGAYFDRLFDVIHSRPAELRRWLLDTPLGNFSPNGRAPSTTEKAEMVALSLSDDEDTVKSVIEAGGEGVTETVLTTSCLSNLLKTAGIDLRSRSMSSVLSKLGWSKVPDRVKWKGVAHRCWVRGNVQKTAESMRKVLDTQDLF